MKIQKIILIITIICLAACVTAVILNRRSTDADSVSGRYDAVINDLTQQMIQAYPEPEGAEKSRMLLRELRNVSPENSRVWEQILDYWDKINREDFVNNVSVSESGADTAAPLPSGLPDDDSLCIIILGYELNPDGTMKDELISRLRLGLSCALQYPNAYVLVTGGATAPEDPDATEADAMAAWLRENGLNDDPDGSSGRLIIENRSLTSAENAVFAVDILKDSYPQIQNAVIVTSDYHVPLGCLLFESQFLLSGDSSGAYTGQTVPDTLTVISNAGAATPDKEKFSLKSQAYWMQQLISYSQRGDK